MKEQQMVYKVIYNQGETLASCMVRNHVVIYPPGKWIKNDTPMLVFLNLEDAKRFRFDHVFRYADQFLEIWHAKANHIFPVSHLLTMPSDYPEEELKRFWEIAKQSDPENIEFRLHVHGGFFPIMKSPPGTYGTHEMVVTKRV